MLRRFFLLACPLALVAQDTPPLTGAPDAAPVSQPPAEQILMPPEPGRFKRLFQPFRTDRAALSPDGRYLAYSLREGDALAVAVVEIARPEQMTAHVKVVDDRAATSMLAELQREPTPARIDWLGWVTPSRVVVETNQVYTTKGTGRDAGWQSWPGTLLAFDADGGNARQIANAGDLVELMADNSAATPGGRDPFSTRREVTWKFLPSEPGAEAGAGALEGDAADPEAAPVGVSAGATPSPRSPRTFDFDPARPGAVTVVASGAIRPTGNRMLGFYSLDATTGKLTSLNDQLITATTTPRIDRQGRVRLTVANTPRFSFPFPYHYLGATGRDRANSLDSVTGLDGFSVSPDNYFGARSVPLGFDEDPNILYYASNLSRDTYGIYSFNLATGQKGNLAIENPGHDLIDAPGAGFPDLKTLVFDRFTRQLAGIRYESAFRTTIWLQPLLRALQGQLEKLFHGRSVELVDWDQKAERFLFSTEGPADPGAFYFYDRAQNKLMEFVRRAPWIDAQQTHATLPYSYVREDGIRISGLVTVPQQPRIKPIPMVVLCPDVPWQRVRPDFQAEVQALADMGFVVVQINGRGAWGLGRQQREAITGGYDLVQVDDIVTTITNLEKAFAVNLRRVALLGRGHGGFIALRALQEHPDKFRCAVALDAPIDLADWLAEQRWAEEDVRPQLTRAWLGDADRLKAAPLARAPGKLTKPALLLSYPGPEGEPRRSLYLAARSFAGKVRRQGGTAEFGDLHLDYMRGLPGARAEVFDRIEAFLNTHVYDYTVKMRDLQILPDKKP